MTGTFIFVLVIAIALLIVVGVALTLYAKALKTARTEVAAQKKEILSLKEASRRLPTTAAEREAEAQWRTTTIDVAKDFSTSPSGRFRSDGPHSAEAFREDVLIPAFSLFDQVTVVLDGKLGCSAEFLEEAFGGLVRVWGFDLFRLGSALILETDKTTKAAIHRYIADAARQRVTEMSKEEARL